MQGIGKVFYYYNIQKWSLKGRPQRPELRWIGVEWRVSLEDYRCLRNRIIIDPKRTKGAAYFQLRGNDEFPFSEYYYQSTIFLMQIHHQPGQHPLGIRPLNADT